MNQKELQPRALCGSQTEFCAIVLSLVIVHALGKSLSRARRSFQRTLVIAKMINVELQGLSSHMLYSNIQRVDPALSHTMRLIFKQIGNTAECVFRDR